MFKKPAVILIVVLVLLCVPLAAMAEDWTCPVCGQTWHFDSRDSGYRSQFAQMHTATHNTGGTSNAGQSGGGNARGWNPESSIWYRRDMAIQSYNKGMAAFNQGDYVAAEQWFRQANTWTRLSQAHRNTFRMIGQCLEKRGLEAEALDAYDTACAHQPLDAEARGLRDSLRSRMDNRAGKELAGQGKWRAAQSKFQSALALNPNDSAVRDSLDEATRHVRHDNAVTRIQQIVNAGAVEAETPRASPTVTFQWPETRYQKAEPGSSPPLVNSMVVDLGVLGHHAVPPPPGEPAGASPALQRQLVDGTRLPNPLNPVQMARENWLVHELKIESLAPLPPGEAIGVIIDRYHAALNQASIAASEQLGSEIRKAQESGRIPPGNVLALARQDPKVADELGRLVENAAQLERKLGEEAKVDASAAAMQYQSQREEYRDREKTKELLARLQAQMAQALAAARQSANNDFDAALDQMRKEGYVIDPANLPLSAMKDPALFARMSATYKRLNDRLANETIDITEYYLRNAPEIMRGWEKESKP